MATLDVQAYKLTQKEAVSNHLAPRARPGNTSVQSNNFAAQLKRQKDKTIKTSVISQDNTSAKDIIKKQSIIQNVNNNSNCEEDQEKTLDSKKISSQPESKNQVEENQNQPDDKMSESKVQYDTMVNAEQPSLSQVNNANAIIAAVINLEANPKEQEAANTSEQSNETCVPIDINTQNVLNPVPVDSGTSNISSKSQDSMGVVIEPQESDKMQDMVLNIGDQNISNANDGSNQLAEDVIPYDSTGLTGTGISEQISDGSATAYGQTGTQPVPTKLKASNKPGGEQSNLDAISVEESNPAEEESLSDIKTQEAALKADQPKENGKNRDTGFNDNEAREIEQLPVEKNEKKTEQGSNEVKKIMEFENQKLMANKSVSSQLPEQESAEGQIIDIQDTNKVSAQPVKSIIEVGETRTEQTTKQVSQQEVVDQIVKKVELMGKQANNEMRIQLKPEFLGKMIIKIIVTEGVVTARFTTESQHVKQVLETNMNSLKQTLEANGLKVERTEVNVALDNGGNFNGSNENRQSMWQEYSSRQEYLSRTSDINIGMESDFSSGLLEETYAPGSENETYYGVNNGRVDFMV